MTTIYLIFNERAQAWACADPAEPVPVLLDRIHSGDWRLPDGLLRQLARYFELPDGHPRFLASLHDDLVVARAVPPLVERGGKPFGEDPRNLLGSLPGSLPPEDAPPVLTDIQRRILTSLAAGLSTRQIAAALKRKPRYVFYQIAEMKQKLGVNTRAELICLLDTLPGLV